MRAALNGAVTVCIQFQKQGHLWIPHVPGLTRKIKNCQISKNKKKCEKCPFQNASSLPECIFPPLMSPLTQRAGKGLLEVALKRICKKNRRLFFQMKYFFLVLNKSFAKFQFKIVCVTELSLLSLSFIKK